MVIGILTCIVCILLIFVLSLLHYTKKLQDNINYYNYSNLATRYRLSMVEYHIRQYREGTNPFTTLRNITNVLKLENKEVVGYDKNKD